MTKSGGIVPPWSLAIGAICSIQLSSALAVPLIGSIGAGGTAWLRTAAAALIVLAIARPPLRSIRGHAPALVGLGVTTGLMSVSFLAALERIPLGTAVAIEFLGPLTVAAVRSRSRRALAWPGLALVGVILLTEPWRGTIDLIGLGAAAVSGTCWGCYIVLTQHVGDRFSGITGLSITLPVAAIATSIIGIPQAVGHLTPLILLAGVGLGLLHPLLTFTLEMTALKRMTTAAFGTLMAVEPAIALLVGLVVLHQQPVVIQLIGIALVVVAGTAAQRGGSRVGPAQPTHEVLAD